MAVKPQAKVALLVIAGATLFGGLRYGASHGYLPSTFAKVLVPKLSQDLPPLTESQITNVPAAPYPSTSKASVTKPLIKGELWEWNANLPLIGANGGAFTTKGSFMEKRNVNLQLIKQNDTNQMVADLVTCAKEIHDGATQCSTGANFITIMGDQFAEVAAQANPLLKKLGADYQLIGIGASGYSRGEDACELPKDFDPKNVSKTVMLDANGNELPVHGVLIAGSIHEGDWDICMKGAADNAIPNNPDPKTFDADAFNWYPETDYTVAGSDYVAGKCDTRKEVKKGKLTGNSLVVCINGVASWTPVDVTVAQLRGGLVKVFDSAMYRSMMPALIVGPKHFLAQNKPEIEDMLRATWDAADQVKAYPSALQKYTQIEAKLYDDEGGQDEHGKPYTNGAYWLRYFTPIKQRDKTGITVSLGGSAVANYQDNLILFGFDGNTNNIVATYNIFRNINLQQYPELYKEDGPTRLPPAKDSIDRSYIQDIKDAIANGDTDTGAAADTQDFGKSSSGDVISSRSYSINFANGSAVPLPDSMAILSGIKDSAAITGLKIKLDGFTDNVGDPSRNKTLSELRAQAVKTYLQKVAPKNFPNNRFVSVEGHGQEQPVSDNATAVGKAANRRVEVALID